MSDTQTDGEYYKKSEHPHLQKSIDDYTNRITKEYFDTINTVKPVIEKWLNNIEDEEADPKLPLKISCGSVRIFPRYTWLQSEYKERYNRLCSV